MAACERGANLYLPEALIPMFPHGVTERLGLGLNDSSPALSVGFGIDSDGRLQQIGIHLTTVRVTRMTYAEATASDDSRLEAIASKLALFRERRMQSGAAVIDLPEVSVRMDSDGISIRPLERGGSRQLVAEAMMAAGEAVAEFALRNDLLIPFANQPPPDEIRTPETMSEMYAYRRLFKPSRMATQPERHFGLGLDHYTRATSPLRRYPDLVTHQQIRAFLQQKPLLEEETIVERIGEASAASSMIRRAERFSNLHWKLVWLSQQQNWRGEAVVVELDERKATLLVPELALESRVRRTPEMALDKRLGVSVQSIDFTVPEVRLRVRES
jgi:exoribonuclease-2